ncbi:MAG: DEAD/DEAH box helicase [bacterium]|nr:DEAD/DEAH box helicase [bacterium]
MSMKFKDFGFKPEIQRALDDAEYDTPTPIQEQAIPLLLGGQDLIGIAETGTGKTLAFLLPIFHQLELPGTNPQALVVCPTRELAMQVAGEAERFGQHLGVRTVLAYGGTSSGDQKRKLAAGCEVVVGTPGRLLDFVNSAWLSLRKLRFAVLDEADRMLDMGFINDVDAILRKTPMSRQSILFSATIPDEIRSLAQRYMLHPETVQMHRGTKVTAKVDHAFYPVHPDQKEQLLVEVLKREKPTKFLVFTATRENTSVLALLLRRHRFEVVSLSSLHSQANRERALQAFRDGDCQALVATDVAARGLDITDIDLVVNFDVPMHAEDYVHRIGRTGRAERTGKAATLVTNRDERRVSEIERLLKEGVPRVELEGFDYRTQPPARKGGGDRPRGRGRGGGGGGRRSGGKAPGGSGGRGSGGQGRSGRRR